MSPLGFGSAGFSIDPTVIETVNDGIGSWSCKRKRTQSGHPKPCQQQKFDPVGREPQNQTSRCEPLSHPDLTELGLSLKGKVVRSLEGPDGYLLDRHAI
jgi:hypothetical protein